MAFKYADKKQQVNNQPADSCADIKFNPAAPQIGNQAMLSGLGVSGSTSTENQNRIKEALAARINALSNQIPAAETEADRIADSVNGAHTPEEVKSQLGEKLCADFSNVKFHTDSSAAKSAAEMGAAAYTSGLNVYFGEDNFEPHTIAHELVHTVQQGAVDSSSNVSAVSVPMGNIQMKPLSLAYNRRYSNDEMYRGIINKMNSYNDSQSEQDRYQSEMELMYMASNYITKYSTKDYDTYNTHKEQLEQLEKMILQISQQDGRKEAAENNLNIMSKNTETNENVNAAVSIAANAVSNGKFQKRIFRNKRISPALQAIMTETFAAQDNVKLNAASQSGTRRTGNGGLMINLHDGTNYKNDTARTAAFLHEATHTQNMKLYGSTFTVNSEDLEVLKSSNKSQSEKEKIKTQIYMQMLHMKILKDQLSNSLMELLDPKTNQASLFSMDQLSSPYSKITYSVMGDDAKNYLPNIINSNASPDNGYANEILNIQGQFNDLNTSAGLSEFYPSMNEMLVNLEILDGIKDTQLYRQIKAEALKGHMKRHNKAILNKISELSNNNQ